VFELWKIRRKKLKNNFSFHCLIWKKSKEKNREKKYKKILNCYEEKFFPQNMKGKFIFSRLSKMTNKLM